MMLQKNMLRLLVLLGGVATITASEQVSRSRPVRSAIVQPRALPSGVPKDCSFLETCTSKDEDCDYFANRWGISYEEFVEWNPSVGEDCSGIKIGQSYCVERDSANPIETTTSPDATPVEPTTTKPAPTNGIETPSPIQDNMVKTCNKFYQIKTTTTCESIESYFNVPQATFKSWNPAVGRDCASLLAGYYVCIGIVGWEPPPPTTTKPTEPTGIVTPTPIQKNMARNCDKFHLIKSTTTCASIESYYNIPLATFLSWNPSVGSGCQSLLVDYYVCVHVIGWVPLPTTTKKDPAPTNGITTPLPIQDGMTAKCNKFHLVKSTTTCASIQDYYKITMAQLTSWNKAIGSTCNGLWAEYNICVGVIGQTPTEPDNGIQTPSPIQTGMTTSCNKFHLVKSTTTCASIQEYYKITMAQLTAWNKAIGSSCTGLWAEYNICVGVIGQTPTKPDDGVQTPSPIQAGMTKNCKKFHFVKSTTTCASLQDYYSITLKQLVAWNPAIGAACSSLWAQYYVCVGV